MKPTRVSNLSSLGASEATHGSLRGLSQNEETKINASLNAKDLRAKISECFENDDEVTLRLKDEFSTKKVENVVRECRAMISGNAMTAENWTAIGEFLSHELWEFSQLKEELVLAERKCGMLQQRASEISASGSQPGEEEGFKNRLMACAMLLAETEMRRDHLGQRVSMIIEEFVTKILVTFSGSESYTGLELRLRAVFGSF